MECGGEGKISEDQWSGVERVRSVRISGVGGEGKISGVGW